MYRFVFLYFICLFENAFYAYKYDEYEIYQDYLKSVCDVYKHFGETRLNVSLVSFNYKIVLVYFEISNFKFIGQTNEKWKVNTEIYDIIKDLVFYINIVFQLNYWIYFGAGCSFVNKWTWKQSECDVKIFAKIILGKVFVNFGINFFINVDDVTNNEKKINKIGILGSVGHYLFHNVAIYPSFKLKLTDYKDIS